MYISESERLEALLADFRNDWMKHPAQHLVHAALGNGSAKATSDTTRATTRGMSAENVAVEFAAY